MKKNVKLLRILCILLISCNLHASSISSRNLPTQHLQYKIISFFVDLFSTHDSVQTINDKSSNDIVSFLKLTSTKSTAAFVLATGDYQSNGNGNWDDPNSWRLYNTATGLYDIIPLTYPGELSGSYTVTIQASDTISVSSNLTINSIGDLVINGTLNLSSNLTTTAMGNVTVNGTLILGDNTSNQHITTLNTQQLTIATTTPEIGTLIFYGPKVRLNLPSNAALIIEPSSTINGDCTNNDEIFIGSDKYATCVGGGSTTYSFGELVASGGSINAEITTPPSNSAIEACSLVSLEGTYTGTISGTTINYQWSILDPNDATTLLTSTESGNISSSSFTPTITGDYLVSFEVSDDSYTNVETRIVTVTNDTTPPTITCPANVTVSANASCEATG
ncbi:hypothetical protein V8G69_09245, partial [Gaetbulibacter sp. M235]|uniref:hypothetical protein n=1 Tax=Gaetbulibacter sp. M235 TaxID=3126510 RepID=UPI00374EB884